MPPASRPGQRVLEVATGTGIAAEAAVEVVGPSGHVVATDLFPPMLEKARERLGHLPNVSFAVEDGQALTIADEGFDAVLCAMWLMLFPDPARGLAEFRRVLRPGGRAAASVNTTPERAFATRVEAVMGRHAPARAATAARYFSLGDAGLLRSLFAGAGFRGDLHRGPAISVRLVRRLIRPGRGRPGAGGAGVRRAPAEVRRAVREEVRRQLEGEAAGAGGPVEVEVELLFGCGRR